MKNDVTLACLNAREPRSDGVGRGTRGRFLNRMPGTKSRKARRLLQVLPLQTGQGCYLQHPPTRGIHHRRGRSRAAAFSSLMAICGSKHSIHGSKFKRKTIMIVRVGIAFVAAVGLSVYYNTLSMRRYLSHMEHQSGQIYQLRNNDEGLDIDYRRNTSDDDITNPIQKVLIGENEISPHRPFPRWGDTYRSEQANGIAFGPILDFIVNSSAFADAPNWKGPFALEKEYNPTQEHKLDVNGWFPETLHVFNRHGVWQSRRHRNITDTGSGSVRIKLEPTERLLLRAHQMLIYNIDKTTKYANATKQWPHLQRALRNTTSAGFPFLVWYGDYTGCAQNNWQPRHTSEDKRSFSIPLFTTAAALNCNYTFPLVTYQSVHDAHDAPNDWDRVRERNNEVYPWSNKLPSTVWRGGLTGFMNATRRNLRWQMLKQFHGSSDVLDVAATRLPQRHVRWTLNVSDVGGLHPSMPRSDYQNYRGILDVDGNSWSARFGRLLCDSSVVLKVQPQYSDYFFPDLVPNKHYIPVKADLSDLVKQATWVADPSNDAALQSIVQHANSWCRRRLVIDSLARDVLDTFERYVELLAVHDPMWSDQWEQVYQDSVLPSRALDMVLVGNPTPGDSNTLAVPA